MVWFLIACALVLHTYFWGAGLTYFITPRRWLRFWWAFSPMAGLALQSAVVWAGAHTALAGTRSYAFPALLLPAGLLVAAVIRLGSRRAWDLLLAPRKAWALWSIMAFCLALQVYPMARLSTELTSMSLGSCDAADYAAGARVFQDFSSRDRSGFLGQGKVTEVPGIDNFQVFWLRLNHFTPSALMALDGAIFRLRPHKLASLFGVVLAVLTLPLAFWLARSAFRLRPVASSLITLLYGCAPVVCYAIYHCALGQLLAAPAVALLTWTGLQSFRGPARWRRLAAYSGLLLVCNWLILGGYNFFIVFSYVPLLAFAGWETLRTKRWKRTACWALLIAGNLVLAAALFPGRVVAVVARVSLINQNHYGWPIPGFKPSGWFGLFASSKLEPATSPFANLLAAACLLALAVALFHLVRRGRWQRLGLALSCSIPILAGYGFLLWQGRVQDDNASYNAYKIFAVFLPGFLASFFLWLDPGRGLQPRTPIYSTAVAALGIAVLCANLNMLPRFAAALRSAGLIVDRRMAKLGSIEQMADIHSVNVCFEVYWSRLWANYFLLRKPHYFRLATYEGRPLTAPLGDWDLREDFLVMETSDALSKREINRSYFLLDRRDKKFLDLRLGHGWKGADFHYSGPWGWGTGSPTIEMANPHPYPLATMVQFSAMAFAAHAVRVRVGPDLKWTGLLGPELQTSDEFPVEIPPGTTELEFETSAAPGDEQSITIGLHHLTVRY
ncbi:MAG: hypothetical protein ACR2ID_08035 [Chthoniobacterales bacterium]